ncbi:metallophosphoesterase [Alkalihalobacterium bogoriense]|uniref:metallophosphoesterase n=1 Tax=Alkalihalobacterium bogoriense TaxID=246272 RepID=UPI00068480C6|nr:metallophosphoesterase [Alkalihalobacterium bogoriense]
MIKQAFLNQVIETEVFLSGFPSSFDGMSLFFISDVHERLIHDDIINEVKGKTDIVIIGGDFIEKGVSLNRAKENLEKLKQVGPVYFVWGNNDYDGDFRGLDALLLESGVKILDNTAVSFHQVNETLVLLGVDDVGVGRDNLPLALLDSEDGFKILVSHNPDIMDEVQEKDNIKLILSGHTHGGQIRLFGWGIREAGGWKDRSGTKILISNGYGTRSIPLRLGAPAQTHFLILKKKYD